MTEYKPTAVNAWAVVDKELDTVVYTLTAAGETKSWRAARVEHTCLLVDDEKALAAWLIDARNKNLQLTRATGWRLEWRVTYLTANPQTKVVYVWWEACSPESEVVGPLFDLDVAFLRYLNKVDAPEKAVT